MISEIRRRPPNPVIDVAYLRYQVAHSEDNPRNILEKIVWHKETEVQQMRERISLLELQRRIQSSPVVKDFGGALWSAKQHPAVIAEVKKASPSKGVIRCDFDPVTIAQSYQMGGATCLSILTDSAFFQGSFDYLKNVRSAVELPLLCKDFIIYPYQMYLARSCGADAILLIAAILSDQDLHYFIKIARSLGMTALVEVHTLHELDRVLTLEGVEWVGINNRDLQTFQVDLHTTIHLLSERRSQLQQRRIGIVSESGILNSWDLQQVGHAGVQAVLVGESLMRQPDPGQGIRHLVTTPTVNRYNR